VSRLYAFRLFLKLDFDEISIANVLNDGIYQRNSSSIPAPDSAAATHRYRIEESVSQFRRIVLRKFSRSNPI
jgi:hypothetical protein